MIFFLGNIYKDDILKKNNKFSPATSAWLDNFIKNLKLKVKIISFYHQPFFPFGKFYVNENNFSKFKNTKYLSYINLPLLRAKIIEKKILEELVKYKEKNITLITYNFSPIILSILKKINSKKVNWISICADYDIKDQKEIFKKLKNSNINIFLSKASYDAYKYKNKIYFNGFQNQSIKKKKTIKIKNFLYSGSLENWTGIKYFLDDFIKYKNNKVKLLITSNSSQLLIKKYLIDKRIKFLGFLNHKEYQKKLINSDCFVNLRDSNNFNNQNNFPSKLLQYIPHCKPIISTNLKNIDKKINKILIHNTKNNYLELIKYVTNLDANNLNKISNKIHNYNKNKKKEEIVFIKKINKSIQHAK